MILVIGGEKGGTGKTTLAVNLAATRAKEGRAVLLVDADKQASATRWCAIRTQDELEPGLTCVAIYDEPAGNLAAQVRKLAPKYDDVVIDTRGADARELRSALWVAHRLVTPIQASQFDLYTMGTMELMVRDAMGFNPELQALAVLNRATTHATSSETDEAREALDALQHFRLTDAVVRERKAWRRCASQGRTVAELEQGDEKAAHELKMLAREAWA